AGRWHELAWRWLDDGVAHRVLLERLERTPPHGAQLAALDELPGLHDDERAVALPRLAAELSPELEAVLVGSLVRGDRLEGVLARPAGEAGNGHGDDRAPGWEAIDAALRPIYGDDADPIHYAAAVPYALGGKDPLEGISAYPRDTPVPHWHLVTYGFTDLFDKESADPAVSGYGFELTLRLLRSPEEETPPAWALDFLQNLGRYVFSTGNRFGLGHKMGLNGPIALGHDTQLTAICFAEDPELGEFSSPFGAARFLQVVGLTDDEYRLVQEWSTTGLVEVLGRSLPFLVTDLARASVLADPEIAAEIERRVAREGSSEEVSTADDLRIDAEGGKLRIELGALHAVALPRAVRGRLRHGRDYELHGRGVRLRLEPSEGAGYHHEEDELVLELTDELAQELEARLRPGLAGTYQLGPWLQIVVNPSLIRTRDGRAIDVRGVADPEEARRLIEEENARLAAAGADAGAGAGGGDGGDEDGEDGEDGEDDEDDVAPPDVDRITDALAMTGRALRLSPGDPDIQLAHATLLLEGDRGGLPGAADELLERLPRLAPQVRIGVAVQLGDRGHPQFGDAVDVALGEPLPEHIFAAGSTAVGGAVMMSFGDVAHELFGELGEAILAHAPAKMARLVPLLPGDVDLLSELARKAFEADQRESALALHDRVLALPIPDDAQERASYLRALNNACVHAHAAKAHDVAVRIAERAQPVAHENPHLYHAAACAYAAAGDLARAFEQVKLAVQHGYDHLNQVEVDADLGPLLEWPEFKALFREWHARREGE
ncbi:MAG TPA: suppressor of fused domain protein, partial [Kofleriaceae bacterium]|nr:suppressor of fused domain protein [Kofleriaceae bacterium]